jgi:hypothetical protein
MNTTIRRYSSSFVTISSVFDHHLSHSQHVAEVLGVHSQIRVVDAVLSIKSPAEHIAVGIELVEYRCCVDLGFVDVRHKMTLNIIAAQMHDFLCISETDSPPWPR